MKGKMMVDSTHLWKAIEWAEGRSDVDLERAYDQSGWDCGTACCLHGAASLFARGLGGRLAEMPKRGDYADLPTVKRDGVMSVLWSAGGTPDLLRRVLRGDVVLGPNVKIQPGVTIGNNVHIGASTWIYKEATVENGAIVGAQTMIHERAYIGPGASIGQGCIVDIGMAVGRNACLSLGLHLTEDGVSINEWAR